MLACQASGAPVIVVEPQAFRRQMARDLGADIVLDPSAGVLVEQVQDHTAGRGATMVLECSGSDGALAAVLDLVGRQGRIVLVWQSVGRRIPIEIGRAIFGRTTIIGSSGSPYYFPKTLTFMSRRLVNLMPVVTHRFPLSQVLAAFELGKSGAGCAKILILP
jgi:L-iditol 2-dehydrogenase